MWKRIRYYVKTVKFWAGVIGSGLTAAGGVAGAPPWLITLGSIATGIAVFEIKYQPMPEENGLTYK